MCTANLVLILSRGHKVHIFDPKTKKNETIEVGQYVGCGIKIPK
jgi:hypothetical protein